MASEKSTQELAQEVWLPIIGRALALLCLQARRVKDETLADKARLLESLGLPRKDVADMLGTSYGSISELLSQAKKRKKGRRKRASKKAR